MEKKQSKAVYKIALMLLAMVLVSAVSVYLVRAYLTSRTSHRLNNFYAEANLKGEIVESGKITEEGDGFTETDYNASYSANFLPGMTVGKIPRVDNDSDNELEMYAGVRLDFYIYCHYTDSQKETNKNSAAASTHRDGTVKEPDNEGRYVKVTYDQFSSFVKLEGFSPTAISSEAGFNKLTDDDFDFTAANYKTGSLGWYEYSYGKSADDKASYFFYNKKLEEDCDLTNYLVYLKDRSTPIFTGVTVKPGLMINARNEAMTTAASTALDSEPSATYAGKTTEARAYNFEDSDITRYSGTDLDVFDESSWSKLAEDPSHLRIYNDFKFKILITGYGVDPSVIAKEAERTDSGNGNQAVSENVAAFRQVYDGLRNIEVNVA